MKKIFTIITCIFLINNTYAQKIFGTVKEVNNKGINAASVMLYNASTKVVIKIAVTNNNGAYEITPNVKGDYFIEISSLGYTTKQSAVFTLNEKDILVPDIILEKKSKQLDDVTVTSKKPPIEIKADKTIINIEGSINAQGSDAFDLVRKSPGVTIDKDDNITLSGKNGVAVYIDGKPSPLSGKELADYLRSLNSNQIESIELITNPSAKYEAAGNAGIINIKLKKNKAFGTNGNFNAGYGIGVYGKYNTSISLNHRNNKVNLFGSYSYNNNTNENNMHFKRSILDTLFNQTNVMKSTNRSNNIKLGMDYFIDKKNTIGFIATSNFNKNQNNHNSNTPVYYIPTNTGEYLLVARNAIEGKRENINLNFNYRYTNGSGKELNLDADYGSYYNYNNQLQPNYYYNFNSNIEYDRKIYKMVSPSKISLYTFKADYEQALAKGKLSLGAKSSFVETKNNFERYNIYTNSNVFDSSRSNNFNYKENINAVYANYTKQIKNFNLQFGVRIENTNSIGYSNGFTKHTNTFKPYDSSFNRSFTDIFPSAAITYNKNPMSQWGLSYSRRIDRPSYRDLNPFEFKLDEYTYMKGNTQLIPQFTNSFSLTHSYKYKLNTTLNYSFVNNVFTELLDTVEKSKTVMTNMNLASQNTISLNISYPIMYKWYTAFFNTGLNYSQYKANFGVGRSINLKAFTFNIFMQNTFKLGKGYTAELSGWFNSPSIWEGTFKAKSMANVDVGFQKQILKGKGNLKLSVSDVFFTTKWTITNNFAGQQFTGKGNWESRQFKINFSYKFGKNTVKSSRQRSTGTEEENKRAQGGGSGLGQ